MAQESAAKKIFDSNPEGRRRVGKSRLSWLEDVKNDLRKLTVET
jgi:hypothetical protein